MAIKVFISHKKCDSAIAEQIAKELESKKIDVYLDTLDNTTTSCRGSKELTEYLKSKISDSSDILVVMSDATKKSWWVPFEIGIASDQNKPIVTYLQNEVDLPEYLDYWPRLRFLSDINIYRAQINYRNRKTMITESRNFSDKRSSISNTQGSIDEFYKDLKNALNTNH